MHNSQPMVGLPLTSVGALLELVTSCKGVYVIERNYVDCFKHCGCLVLSRTGLEEVSPPVQKLNAGKSHSLDYKKR